MRKIFAVWTGLLLSVSSHQAFSFKIKHFSPSSKVEDIRQIRVQFNEPMVGIGAPTENQPMIVDCGTKGSGKWTTANEWVYDFENDLSGDDFCKATMVPGFKSIGGSEFEGKLERTFNGGGPRVISNYPYTLPQEGGLLLEFNTEVDSASVQRFIYFTVEGIENRIEVRVHPKSDLQRLRKVMRDFFYSKKKSDDHYVFIESKTRLPEARNIRLVIDKGLRSKKGNQSQKTHTIDLRTEDSFKVMFSCARQQSDGPCVPINEVMVSFTKSVFNSKANRIRLSANVNGKKQVWSPIDKGGDAETEVDHVTFPATNIANNDFAVNFPEDFSDFTGAPAVNLKDHKIQFKTGELPVLVKFPAQFGVYELNADPIIPVTVRNVETDLSAKVFIPKLNNGPFSGFWSFFKWLKSFFFTVSKDHPDEIIKWFYKVQNQDREKSIFDATAWSTPPAEGSSETFPYKRTSKEEFEVVGMPMKKPGFHVIEVASSLLGGQLIGPNKPMYVSTSALVTNMAVHFKRGYENSLVWVTYLDSAKAVSGALVTIADCTGKVYFEGKTASDGTMVVDDKLKEPDAGVSCPLSGDEYKRARGLVVVAQKGDDMSFTLDQWDNGIEPYRFNVYPSPETEKVHIRTVFDRMLYQASETVHMKHFLREQSLKGFKLPDERPDMVRIQNVFEGTSVDFPLEWDANGTALTSWETPKDAKLGNYKLKFFRKDAIANSKTAEGGSDSEDMPNDSLDPPGTILGDVFMVQEFKIPVLKADLRAEVIDRGSMKQASIQALLAYNAGGPAAGLRGKLSVYFQGFKRYSVEGYQSYSFAGQHIQTNPSNDEESEEIDDDGAKIEVFSGAFDFDQNGSRNQLVNLPDMKTATANLTVDLEYSDPSGEIHVKSTTVPVINGKVLVGVAYPEYRQGTGERVFKAAVVTPDGKPIGNQNVKIEVAQIHSKTHRKKLMGGFYKMFSTRTIDPAKEICHATTDAKGIAECTADPKFNGSAYVVATTSSKDPSAYGVIREYFYGSQLNSNIYVSNGDRMDIDVPADQVDPGVNIPLEIKAPYENYLALITVEHQGVLDAHVKQMSRNRPVFDLPIKTEYTGNIFVSVLAVAQREREPRHDMLVDLARPSVRMGLKEIHVRSKEYRLNVDVGLNQKVFQPRDEVEVSFKVKDGKGDAVSDAEIAVAVVDDGLLQLRKNTSWDIFDNIFDTRLFGVRTSTNILQIVGKRNLGKKALIAPGGGGGRVTTRTLFDTLVLWNPRLKVDRNGEAIVKFKLNDSLTAFRIVGVASSGLMKFGKGEGVITSRKDLMTFVGFPQSIREGDEYDAKVTIKNATDKKFESNVKLNVEGIPDVKDQKLNLEANETKSLSWRLKIPAQIKELKYKVDVESGGKVVDSMASVQKVQKPYVARTIAGTFIQVDGKAEMPIQPAENLIPSSGSVSITAKASITAALAGVEFYMQQYPFECLEQRTSKAIALNDPALWELLSSKINDYVDSNGLLKLYPSSQSGYVDLSAYVLVASMESGFKLKKEITEKVADALNQFTLGKMKLPYRMTQNELRSMKLYALDASSRFVKPSKDLVDQIRGKQQPEAFSDLLKFANILRRADSPEYKNDIALAESKLKAFFDARGSQLVLRDETPMDSSFLTSRSRSSIDYILSRLEFDLEKEDLPRITHGTILQMHRGHWDETFSNAMGTIALRKFADKFQKDPVAGKTIALYLEKKQEFDWTANPKGGAVSFAIANQLGNISFEQQGSGKPWMFINVIGALNLQQPFSSGFAVKKKINAMVQKNPNRYSVGDILLIELRINTQAAQKNVALMDPIAPGSVVMGAGLANDVSVPPEKTRTVEHELYPVYKESKENFATYYFDTMASGEGLITYKVRLNQSGIFHFPPTHIEAMYATDVYGDTPNADMVVEP